MNICIITSSFPANRDDIAATAGLFVRDTALALRKQGHSITVFTPQKKSFDKQHYSEFDVVWFNWWGGKKRLSYMKPYNPLDMLSMGSLFINGERELIKLNRDKKFDFILAMWAVPAGLLAKRLMRKKGVPYIVWALGSDIWTYGKYPILKKVVASVLRNSLYNFADGKKLAEDTVILGGVGCDFLPSSRLLSLENRKIKPIDKKNSLTSSECCFMFVGRYATVKGVDTLLIAFEKFLKKGYKGRLKLFGGGPLEKEILKKVAKKPLAGAVEVNGYVAVDKVCLELSDCSVLVIPSRMESIPLILSDAVQLGKDIIVTDVGDMGELVREYKAGIVVERENATELTDAMINYSKSLDSEFRDGIKKMATLFNLNNSAKIIVDTFNNRKNRVGENYKNA